MIWEQLKTYTERKELSTKAIKEVGNILVRGQYSTDEEIAELNKVLLKLHSDVLFNFFTCNAVAVTEELVEKIVKTIDVQNPVKAGHIYVAVIALAKAGHQSQASSLLMRFVQTNLPKKLSNKLLYDGFRRAIKYGSDSYLFAQLDGWKDREINLYMRLLSECAGYLNDSEFAKATEIFCQNNGKNYVGQGGGTVSETTSVLDGNKPKTPKASDKTVDALDLCEILKLLECKVTAIKAENSSKGEEIQSLRAENLALKNSNMSLTTEAEKLKVQNSEMAQKMPDLESKIRTLNKELEEARIALESNRTKLSNVESAFGQAGQTEIDALKGNIRKRLSLEYEKYIEIKDKTPDLGYYEILLAVLEDVFRALKKNGITF